ncbi:hypothetical protein L1887_07214 [Cichorium endivia]|nr:hypothetical protein L1887_07214 [Cichorium endivia]
MSASGDLLLFCDVGFRRPPSLLRCRLPAIVATASGASHLRERLGFVGLYTTLIVLYTKGHTRARCGGNPKNTKDPIQSKLNSLKFEFETEIGATVNMEVDDIPLNKDVETAVTFLAVLTQWDVPSRIIKRDLNLKDFYSKHKVGH